MMASGPLAKIASVTFALGFVSMMTSGPLVKVVVPTRTTISAQTVIMVLMMFRRSADGFARRAGVIIGIPHLVSVQLIDYNIDETSPLMNTYTV
jgi:hypothetical protein